jgi:RNA polymerase sigma-70 factor (ECF subfamily)
MRWSDDEFAAVFHEVYPGLSRYLECLVGRSGAAQEVAQEAFLRLHAVGRDRVNPGEERFWLYRVASNLARNELRRERIRQTLASAVPSFLIAARTADPHAEAERNEADRAALAALERLPAGRRAALLLREQDGLGYDEIARVLGVSTAKVKVDIFRARTQLRASLGPDAVPTTPRTEHGERRGST